MNPQPEQLAGNGQLLRKQACCACGYEIDAATSVTKDEARPEPGDLTLCLNCGEIMTWDTEGRLVTPTLQELMEAGPEVNRILERAQKAIRRMRPLQQKEPQ